MSGLSMAACQAMADWRCSVQPLIELHVNNCRVCDTQLIDTGFDKLLAPPLRVMACPLCRVTYWRKTVAKPRHPYEVADRECETKTGVLETQGNDLTPRPAQPEPLSPEQRQAARANELMGLDEFVKHLETHKVDRTIVLNKVPLETQVVELRSQVLSLTQQVETLQTAVQKLSQYLEEHKRSPLHHTHAPYSPAHKL